MSFTQSPTKGDTYTFRGVEYTFNGRSWTFIGPNDGTSGSIQTYSGPFAEPIPAVSSFANASGYFFQNSSYFINGLTHTANPDVVEEVEEGTATLIKWTSTVESESLNSDSPLTYDQATGVISLTGVTADMFILVRVNCDVEPDSDESSAKLILECQANGASGAFTFNIEEQFLSMDQGANRDYEGLSSVPIFIGDTLADNGGTATITPKVQLTNTEGDLKPRTLAVYIWR